ncbi:MAG: UbiX family flavin prenyltransferase [Candidatus Lokiarchaeota archaeon]|nr:UbiX family flavin prenyltransferase [Candidatus Lokiarchaeota archaeon]MBD3342920.1 UbiX family flavin prenyltransferase [Candidatus Lokiarchaeota archaeon]
MLILICITGASGVSLALELLKVLKEKQIDTELIISKVAKKVIRLETDYKLNDFYDLTKNTYDYNDLTAAPASGSYKLDGMIVVPCTMKTLAAISHGYADNLITRTADVMIKEKRPLILITRESPLSVIHLENMLKLAKLGIIIAPPVPSFYIKPETVEDLISHMAGRILDQININIDIKRWGIQSEKDT